MSDEFDIFNTNPKEFENKPQSSESNNMYKPKAKDGKGNVYKSYIRFVPNIENPKLPYIHKFVHYLRDEEGDLHVVDSPTTVGKKNDPLTKRFFSLRNSNNPKDKKKSSDLKRSETNYALIQIVKDDNRPDLAGKIMIFRFGQTIREKLEDMMFPPDDNSDDDFVKNEPINVFDPMDAPVFELNITLKEQFNNYNNSKFIEKRVPILLLDENNKLKEPTNDDDGKKKIISHLKENSPSISDFEFKNWDDETEQFIHRILKKYVPEDKSSEEFDNVGEAVSNASSNKSTSESNSGSSKKEADNDFDDFISDIGSETESKSSDSSAESSESSSSEKQSEQKEEKSKNDDEDEDLENYFNELGI